MRTADKFCDLAGFDPERDEPVVYAHDGSQVTLIEIDGIRTIVSGDDYLINVSSASPAGSPRSSSARPPDHDLLRVLAQHVEGHRSLRRAADPARAPEGALGRGMIERAAWSWRRARAPRRS